MTGPFQSRPAKDTRPECGTEVWAEGTDLARTVEASSKQAKGGDDDLVRVGLDGVVWLNVGHGGLPFPPLPDDGGEVGDVERLLRLLVLAAFVARQDAIPVRRAVVQDLDPLSTKTQLLCHPCSTSATDALCFCPGGGRSFYVPR